jgi:hypothetical protein
MNLVSIKMLFFGKYIISWLVPEKVSESDFWSRYLFRVNEAKEAAGQREELLRNCPAADVVDHVVLSWNDEDVPTIASDPSEEQIRSASEPQSVPGTAHDHDDDWDDWS